MFDEVLTTLIGRVPHRTPAVAPGWRVIALPQRVYPGLIPADDTAASGVLLDGLTPDEWALLDAFEDDLYQLHRLTVADSGLVWGYVCEKAPNENTPWGADQFRQNDMAGYLNRCAYWRALYRPQTRVN